MPSIFLFFYRNPSDCAVSRSSFGCGVRIVRVDRHMRLARQKTRIIYRLIAAFSIPESNIFHMDIVHRADCIRVKHLTPFCRIIRIILPCGG